jgi:hypothetical protein
VTTALLAQRLRPDRRNHQHIVGDASRLRVGHHQTGHGRHVPQLIGIPRVIEGEDINIEGSEAETRKLLCTGPLYMNQYEVMKQGRDQAVGVKTQGGGDALITLESGWRSWAHL